MHLNISRSSDIVYGIALLESSSLLLASVPESLGASVGRRRLIGGISGLRLGRRISWFKRSLMLNIFCWKVLRDDSTQFSDNSLKPVSLSKKGETAIYSQKFLNSLKLNMFKFNFSLCRKNSIGSLYLTYADLVSWFWMFFSCVSSYWTCFLSSYEAFNINWFKFRYAKILLFIWFLKPP